MENDRRPGEGASFRARLEERLERIRAKRMESLTPEQRAQEKKMRGILDSLFDTRSADEIMSSLTPRERRVLDLRFGLEDGRSRTQTETAREVNVSRRTVGRDEKSALAKLRHPSRLHRGLSGYFSNVLR